MRKNHFRIVSLVFAMLFCFLNFYGCKNTTQEPEPLPEEYSSYKKEVGSVMFWEKEDTVYENTVEPNIDIHIYNYCPSFIQVDEKTRYVYYCSNRYSTNQLKDFTYLGASLVQSGDYKDYYDEVGDNRITDYVACRKGILHNGEWYWSEKSYVLAPTQGSMTEGEQTCDPNVIKGSFKYKGKTYPYLMNYLACSTRDNTFNHICLAVAEDPMGPWIKCDSVPPLREYTIDGVPDYMLETYLWGYGQASMISVDKKGKVLMFYSSICPRYSQSGDYWTHSTTTMIEKWDLSDIENPVLERSYGGLPNRGIMRHDKQVGALTNGDYAYDPVTNRIYGIFDSEIDRNGNTSGAPVAYIENVINSQRVEIGGVFNTPESSWGLGEGQTHWTMLGYSHILEYNNYTTTHNTAIIRDAYGWIVDPNKIEVAVTGALNQQKYMEKYPAGKPSDYLWSYRIQRVTFNLT